MEWKDWLSAAAVAISLLALRTARASYRLAKEQDRRELEREQPQVSIIVPPCDGIGPWAITYEITNRKTETMIVEGIRLPLDFGLPPITERHPIRFADINAVEHRTGKAVDSEAGNYEVLVLNTPVQAGQSISGSFEIIPEPRTPLGRGKQVRFYVDVVMRDRAETAYRLRINRIVKPT